MVCRAPEEGEKAQARQEGDRDRPLTSSFSGSAQLKVKLTAKAKKALKKARSVKVSVRGVATDDAGNAAAPLLKRVTLKR